MLIPAARGATSAERWVEGVEADASRGAAEDQSLCRLPLRITLAGAMSPQLTGADVQHAERNLANCHDADSGNGQGER